MEQRHGQRIKLNDNDNELERVLERLEIIHETFYETSPIENSVIRIIPSMKQKVFYGLKFAFSSIFPLEQNPVEHDLWIQASKFGAACSLQVDSTTTHLIAGKRGTVKYDTAKETPGLCIVNVQW